MTRRTTPGRRALDDHEQATRTRARRPRSRVAAVAALSGVAVIAAAAGVAAPASADPPPGRAYELVSPIDDPSVSVAGLRTDLVPTPGFASEDGDRMIYGSMSGLGSPWSGVSNAMIFGERTATGWRARTATVSLDRGDTPTEAGLGEPFSGLPTPDARSYTFWAGNLGALTLPPGQMLPGIFRATDDGAPSTWLSRPIDGVVPVPYDGVNRVEDEIVANRERSTVAFASRVQLTAGAPSTGVSAVYAWRAGRLELASRMPDGTAASNVFGLACTAVSARDWGQPAVRSLRCNGVAGDGRYVLFRVLSSPAEGVYVRDLQQQATRQITGPAAGRPGVTELAAAARDADRAYFPLGGSGVMQEVNLETGTVVPRPAITGEPYGLSADGRRMLFLESPSGANGNNWTLRFWDGEASPDASVRVGTVGPNAITPTFGDPTQLRVYRSRDGGRTWIFGAVGSLDPVRPNATPDTLQLYRWSVGDAAPRCLSCAPVDGVARTTGINLTVQEVVGTEMVDAPTVQSTNSSFGYSGRSLAQAGRSVSDDGRWILFDSPDRLVAADTNDVRDVYLWDRDAAEGRQLQLVTSGQGLTPSYALDLDRSGRNAFFSTRDGLVPADRNGNYDVYVARTGGGFPSAESCVGEACRPPVIPDPPRGGVGSSNPGGSPQAGAQQGPQRGTPKLRVRSVRTSSQRLTLRVDTPQAGRIRVTGKAVRSTSRAAKRATTYTVRVPLSAATKRSVARGRTVRVHLRVSFTPTGGKKATTVRTSVSVRKGR